MNFISRIGCSYQYTSERKSRDTNVFKKAMFCVGEQPLPERVEPSIQEDKECPYYSMLIIVVFLCVPNQMDRGCDLLLRCPS